MFLLSLWQEDRTTPLAVFETEESLQEFIQKIPGYKRIEDDIEGEVFTYDFIDPKQLPDYIEIAYNGNLVPFTRFMFDGDEDVELYWQALPNLDGPNQGLVDGGTKVDAYILGNEDVKEYIELRESGYKRVSQILADLGYTAWRDFKGSEDGEAILFKKDGGEDESILVYLDPAFQEIAELEDQQLKDWVNSVIQERE